MADRRKVLEGIINSPDPAVTARDRLDALARLDESAPAPDAVAKLLAEIPDEEALDAELDSLLAPDIFETAVSGTGWPDFGELIRAEVERRAAELADEERLQLLVEERARQLAAELYVGAGLDSITQTLESVSDEAERADTLGEPSEVSGVVGDLPALPALAFEDELPKRPRRARRRRIRPTPHRHHPCLPRCRCPDLLPPRPPAPAH